MSIVTTNLRPVPPILGTFSDKKKNSHRGVLLHACHLPTRPLWIACGRSVQKVDKDRRFFKCHLWQYIICEPQAGRTGAIVLRHPSLAENALGRRYPNKRGGDIGNLHRRQKMSSVDTTTMTTTNEQHEEEVDGGKPLVFYLEVLRQNHGSRASCCGARGRRRKVLESCV